jgi:hypothetical protein
MSKAHASAQKSRRFHNKSSMQQEYLQAMVRCVSEATFTA